MTISVTTSMHHAAGSRQPLPTNDDRRTANDDPRTPNPEPRTANHRGSLPCPLPTAHCRLDRLLPLDQHIPPAEMHRKDMVELARGVGHVRLTVDRQAVGGVARRG